jgi:hypothetical protein
LGATISGLISRSVLNRDVIGEHDFHGCVFYEEFQSHDLSNWFVDAQFSIMKALWEEGWRSAPVEDLQPQKRIRTAAKDCLDWIRYRFGIRNTHHVKPGIGETTRVLLRRKPSRVMVNNQSGEDIRHVLMLAEQKGVPVEVCEQMPWQAVAMIEEVEL